MEIKESELEKFKEMHREAIKFINLNPIQRGGIVPSETRTLLGQWIDGYSAYDLPQEHIATFVHKILPEFLGCDDVEVTTGAREGIFMIMHSLCEKGDWILVDGNAHYTTFVAAERVGLNVEKTPVGSYPEYKINEEDFDLKIKEMEAIGRKPKLALLTYPDGNYGNLPDAKKVAEICKKYDVPLIINGAYSVGRMPVGLKEIGADFIIASGHKSMASSGPIGLVGTTKRWVEKAFAKSKYNPAANIETLRDYPHELPLISLMASFPYIVKRIKKWDEEVKKARYFVAEITKIEGIKALGEQPHNHDLLDFETPIFYEISKKHKRRGFFLYDELKKQGIIGIKPGLTKNFKLSTYLLSDEEIKKVVEAFEEIVNLKF